MMMMIFLIWMKMAMIFQNKFNKNKIQLVLYKKSTKKAQQNNQYQILMTINQEAYIQGNNFNLEAKMFKWLIKKTRDP